MFERSSLVPTPGLHVRAGLPVGYRHSHERRGAGYDAKLGDSPLDVYFCKAEALHLSRLMGTVLPAHVDRYLDFACGTGRIARQLETMADESYGVDVSAGMLEAARHKCRFTEFLQIDLTRDPHDLGLFDLVTAFRFFGNAEPELRAEALLAINRVLKRGGALVINNHRNPYTLAQFFHRLTGGSAELPLSHFDLRRQLARAGFRIHWQRPIGFWLYRTRLHARLDEVHPGSWPESAFASSWLAPFAPDSVIVAVKVRDV